MAEVEVAMSSDEELRRLNELRDAGVLTDEEFQRAKQRLAQRAAPSAGSWQADAAAPPDWSAPASGATQPGWQATQPGWPGPQGGATPPPPPPAWQAPPYGGIPPSNTDFFSALFDVNFRQFITPKIIKAFYILVMIAAGLFALSLVFYGSQVGGNAGALIALLVVGPLYFFITVILWRLVLEFFAVMFRIGEDIRDIRQRGGGLG
ncbi:MAG: DUF4282 domain-containing protein [Egibacteraceae bacterium]